MSPGLDALPWRRPGEGRPEDLPLPPAKMPLRYGGANRKRWRYIGVFCDELMLCAARVQVGPLGQTFWAVWDRSERELVEQTKMRLPGGRGEVWTEGPDGGSIDNAPDEGALVRIEASHPEAGEVRAFLRAGSGQWVESVCPTGEGAYVWTRKRSAPVDIDVRIGGRRIRAEARAIEDESAGYHPRHTVWNWSAGIGELVDGRAVAWNLVEGVNDPAERSERAIWIDGEPVEPAPVKFDGLDAVSFGDGSRLECSAEAERAKDERKPFVKYSYRQPFGTFAGTLEGGFQLSRGLGVMEAHDATW